jgi:hypothetical protein
MEEENVQVTPCFTSDGINFMHIRISNLYSQSSHVLSQWNACLAARWRLFSGSAHGALSQPVAPARADRSAVELAGSQAQG